MALGSPPLTGASRKPTPRSFSRVEKDRDSSRRHGAHVHHQTAWPKVGGGSVRTEKHTVHHGTVGKNGEQNITLRPHGGGRELTGALGGQALYRCGIQIVDRWGISCFTEVGGHGCSHDPQADETDAFQN